MKRYTLFSLILAFLFSVSARADLPFRNHRYDAFKILPVDSNSIVFVGNSITNMHEWCEAFNNPHILNRGVSGAVSNELRANLGAILPGKPAKMFFLIGTNDLGTPGMNNAAHVAKNVRAVLQRCQKESPRTQLYVQGILPSNRRKMQLIDETNDSIERICRELGVTYISLRNELLSVSKNGDHTHSLDGLHLTASGYRIWCNKIAPYVGSQCCYPAKAANATAGLEGSYGMRASYFAMYPVQQNDILLIGDEAVHGGEWHELLHSPRIKNRGTGWGYPGTNIAQMKAHLHNIFKGRPDNAEPAQVYLYVGTADAVYTKKPVNELAAAYRTLVEEVRRLAPHASISIQALLPTIDKAKNNNRIVPFNARLKQMAGTMQHVRFVDTYTPMAKDGIANPEYFQGDYLSGLGYARLSEILAPLMGNGVRPTTVNEARAQQARFTPGQ